MSHWRKSGHGRGFCRCHAVELCLCDNSFNPLFKLADLAFEKCFETAAYILWFSVHTLFAMR